MAGGSNYSILSKGNATTSGPKRKTWRGKKKRNLSTTNIDVSISDSFQATLADGRARRQGASGSPYSANSGGHGALSNPIRLDKAPHRSIQGDLVPATSESRTFSTPTSKQCPILGRISELAQAGNPYEGARDGAFGLDDSRVIECEVEYTTQKHREDHHQLLNQTQEIDVNQLLPKDCQRLVGKKIQSKGVVEFIIMRRREGSSEEWEFFP